MDAAIHDSEHLDGAIELEERRSRILRLGARVLAPSRLKQIVDFGIHGLVL